MRSIAGLLLLLASCTAARPLEIICCGADEVYILDITDGKDVRKVWSWKAPESLHPLFRSTDECKPVDEGRRILITSSGGGVALVDRETRKTLFHAHVQNAHSAELLPGNRVAVAGSYGEKGNRLVVFDLDHSDRELASVPLYSGHGVSWDADRKRLWALGEKQLNLYRLEEATPVLEQSFPLPTPGGHDLRPVPDTDLLIVSSNTHVYLFDRAATRFTPFPGLEARAKVKGVDIHPETRRVVYTAGEERWWTHRIRFLEPSGELLREGERLYKVRWNP